VRHRAVRLALEGRREVDWLGNRARGWIRDMSGMDGERF
jgi:hypothetical protein